MLISATMTGVLGGLLAAASTLALGHPVLLALMAYSLSGCVVMVGFALISAPALPQD